MEKMCYIQEKVGIHHGKTSIKDPWWQTSNYYSSWTHWALVPWSLRFFNWRLSSHSQYTNSLLVEVLATLGIFALDGPKQMWNMNQIIWWNLSFKLEDGIGLEIRKQVCKIKIINYVINILIVANQGCCFLNIYKDDGRLKKHIQKQMSWASHSPMSTQIVIVEN
mgnify:CR=1 FL=1